MGGITVTDLGVYRHEQSRPPRQLIRVREYPSAGQYVFDERRQTYLLSVHDYGRVDVHWMETPERYARFLHSILRDYTPVSMRTSVAIVGSRYHQGAERLLRKMEGRRRGSERLKLYLARQPSNEHDRNAVAVYFQGRMLGYAPRQDARVLARVIDNGVEVKASYVGDGMMECWWPASTRIELDRKYTEAMR